MSSLQDIKVVTAPSVCHHDTVMIHVASVGYLQIAEFQLHPLEIVYLSKRSGASLTLYYFMHIHSLLFIKSKTYELKRSAKAILIAVHFKHHSLFDVVFI